MGEYKDFPQQKVNMRSSRAKGEGGVGRRRYWAGERPGDYPPEQAVSFDGELLGRQRDRERNPVKGLLPRAGVGNGEGDGRFAGLAWGSAE